MSTFFPSFWPRVLGTEKWKIELSSKGVHINNNIWLWEEEFHCKVEKGWFSRTIEISGSKNAKVNGASRLAANVLLSLSRVALKISVADSIIDRSLAGKMYFADYDRISLVRELQTTAPANGDTDTKRLSYVPDLKQKYERVLKFIGGDRVEIDRRNSLFVISEIKHWDEWFQKIETSPLTAEQARSVVIMEDRNLLVASAGSGKTSTLVAKAGYAIAKGYCNADEVLILTFNRRIKEELAERIQKRFSAAGLEANVTIDTFNSFGYREVKRMNKMSRLAPWADSQKKEFEHLQFLLGTLIKQNPSYAYLLAEFLAVWFESDENEENEIITAADTGTFDEAMQLLLNRSAPPGTIPTYITLNGETVRSIQELRICNWLTLMGVNYEYERPFIEQHVPSDWQSGYRPDFYYPAISCWHEHFGLNKLGKAPTWFTRQGKRQERTYEEDVAAKRTLLTKSGEKWFETTSSDFYEENWETKILMELQQKGLSPEFIGWERFCDFFETTERVTKDLISIISSCLRHAKSNRLPAAAVSVRLGVSKKARFRSFQGVFIPIYEAYEKNLLERRELDFEDMVIGAADGFRNGMLGHCFNLILVDEFQDVSNSRAELISSMLAHSAKAKLFGVGDDWQSIYRFAGADITSITKFGPRLGFTSRNALTQTFRNNQIISDVASRFIMQNPLQLKKIVKAISHGSPGSVEVVFYDDRAEDYLEEALNFFAKQFNSKAKIIEILLLGRYNFLKPSGLERWQKMHQGKMVLSFLTIHRSKGLEADIVILLGATNKKGQNFPSTIQDDPLISYFMPDADEVLWAEERRLLYVALTRAREKVVILTPKGHASPFVQEVIEQNAMISTFYSGNGMVSINDPKPFLKLPECPRCGKGSVMKRVSQYGPFEFCNKRCGYKKNLPLAS